jgi:hypothetical protein
MEDANYRLATLARLLSIHNESVTRVAGTNLIPGQERTITTDEVLD